MRDSVKNLLLTLLNNSSYKSAFVLNMAVNARSCTLYNFRLSDTLQKMPDCMTVS